MATDFDHCGRRTSDGKGVCFLEQDHSGHCRFERQIQPAASAVPTAGEVTGTVDMPCGCEPPEKQCAYHADARLRNPTAPAGAELEARLQEIEEHVASGFWELQIQNGGQATIDHFRWLVAEIRTLAAERDRLHKIWMGQCQMTDAFRMRLDQQQRAYADGAGVAEALHEQLATAREEIRMLRAAFDRDLTQCQLVDAREEIEQWRTADSKAVQAVRDELARLRAELQAAREDRSQWIDEICNEVWNEVQTDPQWGAAQAAAITLLRKRLAARSEPEPRP